MRAAAEEWLHTTSPEEAVHHSETAFYPMRLTLLGPSRGFARSQRLTRVGPVTVGDVVYASDVRLDYDISDEPRRDYHVTIPLFGRLDSRHFGRELTATVSSASIFRPDGHVTVTRWHGGSRHLSVKIEQAAVHTALERLTNRPVTRPVAFAPELPLQGPAQGWVRLLAATHHLGGPDAPLRNDLFSAPLVDSLIHGLLLVADHPYRKALADPAPPGYPVMVRRAMEIIEAAPELPLTSSTLAAQCHVSVRTLQDGFNRHLGVSPMGYVRQVRLRRAHRDLRSADPACHTVASIAHRWGFTHLGRFAAAYKAAYGESPARALRYPR
jgi:AraC-like DNA-binding protein